ncbi:MAG: cytoplasmic protein [Bacteroidetes bacterium]|nr:MAG: cytoplasmic protein [Bacteroidota bacterium]
MNYTNDFLDYAHDSSFKNRITLASSNSCACFYCLQTFSPSVIEEWIEDKDADTAVCPFCGIDSVISEKSGLPISDSNFLKQMQERYFN